MLLNNIFGSGCNLGHKDVGFKDFLVRLESLPEWGRVHPGARDTLYTKDLVFHIIGQ